MFPLHGLLKGHIIKSELGSQLWRNWWFSQIRAWIFDFSSYGLLRRDWNGTVVSSRGILTGKYGGEEDVIRKGDEATFSQGVKYAVLVRKLLSLLGNLLLGQGAKGRRWRRHIKTISHNCGASAAATGVAVRVKESMCVNLIKAELRSSRIIHTRSTYTHVYTTALVRKKYRQYQSCKCCGRRQVKVVVVKS